MSGTDGISPQAWLAIQSRQRIRIVLLLEEQDRTVAELAVELGISRSATLRHVRGLEAAGVAREIAVEAVPGGKRRSYGTTVSGWAAAIARLNELADAGEAS